jgi:Asp-tRNA(Asn)/Glu-tRNA(Gln) amidotransferase A subunit family amidase
MQYTQKVTFPAWMAGAPAAEIAALSLSEAGERLRAREVSSVELTRACLERIHALDGTLHAFITVTEQPALEQARTADEEIARGEYRGLLHGIPTALKDLVDTAGVRTTAASLVFAQRVPNSDAPIVTQLREAGAVLVGKTNLHEFAYGGSGMISAYGIVRNPLDPARVAGGSSSGSAAAVAAGLCFAAIGTDTAGSIRLPAACCGVVGLKPTYGLISAQGVIPLAETYDHVGPITRTVADAEAVMRVLAPKLHGAKTDRLRIAVARKYFFDALDRDVARVIEEALSHVGAQAASMREIDVPVEEDRTAQTYESYRYHAERVAATPELYDPQTLARILRGRDVAPEQYESALARTHALRARTSTLFDDVDVILTPTVPIPPPTIAELKADPATLRARELLMLRNTRPFNVLGVPTVTVPCGITGEGLPVGLQIAAARGEDLTALRFARQLSA